MWLRLGVYGRKKLNSLINEEMRIVARIILAVIAISTLYWIFTSEDAFVREFIGGMILVLVAVIILLSLILVAFKPTK